MARSVEGFKEEMCYVHRGLIQSWDDNDGIQALHPIKFCSYCFERAEQRVVTILPGTERKVYECTYCNGATEKCKSNCEQGFSRSGAKECAVCRQEVPDWKDAEENRRLTRPNRVCSWCLELSSHAIRDEAKSIYQCLSCYSKTTPCKNMEDTETMAAVSMFKSNCIKCKTKQKDDGKWEKLLLHKADVDLKYQTNEYVLSEARRASEYRIKAFEVDCGRPFLILVCMHPSVRSYVAMSLGIVLSLEDEYLDSHAEAWLILNKPRLGIISRTRSTFESLRVKGTKVNWYTIVMRVMEKFVAQAEWPAVKCDDEHEAITELETTMYRNFLGQKLAKLSDIARKNYELLKAGPEYNQYLQQLRQARYYSPVMDVYVDLQLFQAFHTHGLQNQTEQLSPEEVSSSNLLALYSAMNCSNAGTDSNKNRFKRSGYTAMKKASKVAGNVAAKAALSLINPFLGVAVLATHVTTTVCGESIDVCEIPVREILIYQALLRARGIHIEELVEIN